jgi:hypothetical protein
MRRPGSRTTVVATRLGAALLLLAGAGCRTTLCQNLYPASLRVWLAEGWPGAEGLALLVGCPPHADCGFTIDPVTGPAGKTLYAETYLRPPTVVVTVLDTATGGHLLDRRYDVRYQPVGRQDQCGGLAYADIVVELPEDAA